MSRGEAKIFPAQAGALGRRMTKQRGRPSRNDEVRKKRSAHFFSSFGFRHCFELRISGFVIFLGVHLVRGMIGNPWNNSVRGRQEEKRNQKQSSGNKLQETQREMRMDAEAEPAPEKSME